MKYEEFVKQVNNSMPNPLLDFAPKYQKYEYGHLWFKIRASSTQDAIVIERFENGIVTARDPYGVKMQMPAHILESRFMPAANLVDPIWFLNSFFANHKREMERVWVALETSLMSKGLR